MKEGKKEKKSAAEEKIEFAALKYKERVFTGKRHALIAEKIYEDFKIMLDETEQGFVTNNGRFVNRSEAAKIAFKAGQIGPGIYSLDSYQVFP